MLSPPLETPYSPPKEAGLTSNFALHFLASAANGIVLFAACVTLDALRRETEVFEPNCDVFLLLYKELLNSSDHLGRLFHHFSNERLQLFAPGEFHFDTTFFCFGNQLRVVQSFLISVAQYLYPLQRGTRTDQQGARPFPACHHRLCN